MMTVWILLFLLLALIVLLIFLYKKLNKEADGKYTVRNMVYRKGGIRDQVRDAVLAVGTRLGVQLWPGGKTDDDGEEMQEIQDEEGQVEDGSSLGSDSEGDDSSNQSDERRGKGEDTSDDNSDSEGSREEQEEVTDQHKAKGETEEETKEKMGDGKGKGEASGGAGLLIDLKQFSGSAIWSEEGGGEVKDGDVTAL